MRFFNTTGSCDPARHYMIPAERRLPGCEPLIAKGAYFDARTGAEPVEERTHFEETMTSSGRKVTVLRA